MKPKAKMLLLTLALSLPYMGFIAYHAITSRQHQFPSWFLYFAPWYFFGSIALLAFVGKAIQGNTPAIDSKRRKLTWLWLGAGFYALIFLNGLHLGFADEVEVPLVSIVGAEVLNGAILATFILALRKAYKRVQ